MFHTNAGELHQLFSTFNRVWGAGGAASLSLKTVDGKVSAVLDVQLGPPADLRPGAPEVKSHAAGGVHQQRGQQQRRRHRGPGRQARDAARRNAWIKRRQETQPPLPALHPPPPPPPPPPLPAAPPRRLVTVVRDKTSRIGFSQLDGGASPTSSPSSPTSPTPVPYNRPLMRRTPMRCTTCFSSWKDILSGCGNWTNGRFIMHQWQHEHHLHCDRDHLNWAEVDLCNWDKLRFKNKAS